MNKTEFLSLVRHTIKENPDWLADLNNSIMSGVKLRLEQETDARANAETALCIAYDNAKGIPKNQIGIVRNAIKNSFLVGGTEYANKL